MKKLYTLFCTYKLALLFTGLFFLFGTKTTFADHIVGSDLSYQCTATPGVYKVVLKVYRDCAGAPFCYTCDVPVPNGNTSGCTTANSCCGFNNTITGADPSCMGVNFGTFTLDAQPMPNGFDIIQTCASVKTICKNCNTRTAGTFAPGIEVYTFVGTVNLNTIPASCCKVALGFSLCCRNQAITNFVPGNFYCGSTIDRCQTPCNSAPTFTNDAAALVCAGVDFIYNLGAIDPDGDSLSYAFGQSMQSPGSPVSYNPPYSAGYPFAYLGAPNPNAPYPAGIRIDPLTGDVMFRPSGTWVSNLVIEVTQWKLVAGNWVVVGITRRDVQFQTMLCTGNLVPKIKVYRNGTLQTSQSFSVCAGQQICLDIVAEDQTNLLATPAPILADSTDLTWNNPGQFSPVMANATWVRNYVLAQRGIQGPKADSFKFCWTPPVSAARTQPHSFTVKGVDRYCPVPAAAIRGINITVVAIPIPIITVIDKKCGFRDFSFVLANPAQTSLNTSQTQWQIETTPGGGFFTNMNSQSLTNYKFTQGGTYKYRLRLNSVQPSPSGCPSLDSGFILNPEPLDVSVANTYNCIGSPAKITAHASGGNRLANIAFYEFFLGGISSQASIKGSAIGASRDADSTLSVSPTNVGNSTQYKVKIGDWDNCVDSTTFSVLTRALPLRELTPKIRLCEGDDTSFFVGNNGSVSVQKAYWYIAPNLTLVRDSQLTYPITKVKFTDSATYVLKKIDVYGCTVLDTTQLLINSPVSFITPKDSACNNDPVFPLRGLTNTMYIDSFVWYSLNGTTRYVENDTFLQPTSIVGTQQYLVRGYNTYDGKQCYKDDTATFKVNGLPVITNRPQAVPLCQDQGLYNLGSVQTTNPPTAQTSQVWTYPPNVNAFPNAGNKSLISIDSLKYLPTPTNWAGKAFGNYAYITVTATTTGCIRRDSALLGIFPVSPVNINPPPRFCDFDANYNLYNLTRFINGSGIDEEWQGNGVTYNAGMNRWFFNPSDTPNIVGGTNVGGKVNAGLSSPSDTNILSYIFTRRFAASVQVAFSPTRTGVVTMGSPVNGCPSSDTVLFRVTKSPKLKAGSLPTVCVGKDSMYLSTSAFAGTNSTTAANPATSYWYFAAPNKNLRAIARGQVFMPFHPDIVVAKDQSKVYQLIYADTATGCRAADTTNLTVKGLPTVDIVTANIKDSAVCLTRDSLKLTLTPNPLFLSLGSDSLSLTGAPGLVADYGRDGGMFRFVGNSLQEQPYKLQYYYRTPEGCSGKDSFNVRIQYPPKVNLGPDAAACEYGAEFTINVVDPPSKFSNHPYGLAWEVVNQSGTIVKQTTDSLIYRASQTEINNGSVQVRVVTTNLGLCPVPAADTAIFTIYKKPVADFTGIDSGCVRTHAPFTSLNVNYTAVPSGVPGSNYIWFVNDAPVIDSLEKVNFSTSFATPGNYRTKLVVVNKTTTCSDTSDIKTSTAWLTPVADFEPNKYTTTVAKPSFIFYNRSKPDTDNIYWWNFGVDPLTGLPRTSTDANPTEKSFASDTGKIAIKLRVTSVKGCVDSVTKYVEIEPDITVFIPNVFWPRTDGKGGSQVDCQGGNPVPGIPCNSQFYVQARGFETIDIYVYNRWGKLVFQTKDIKQGWNGIDQKTGGECQQDAYVYQIFATSFAGKKYQYSGSLTLMR